jgi:hypothetical protein
MTGRALMRARSTRLAGSVRDLLCHDLPGRRTGRAGDKGVVRLNDPHAEGTYSRTVLASARADFVSHKGPKWRHITCGWETVIIPVSRVPILKRMKILVTSLSSPFVATTLPRSTRQVGAWIEQEFGLVYAEPMRMFCDLLIGAAGVAPASQSRFERPLS